MLFIDNYRAHNNLPNLDCIKIVYLPPNTTSKSQPIDQGIINNFKVFYRKDVVYYILRSLEVKTNPDINLLLAMRFARKVHITSYFFNYKTSKSKKIKFWKRKLIKLERNKQLLVY